MYFFDILTVRRLAPHLLLSEDFIDTVFSQYGNILIMKPNSQKISI